MVEIKGNFPQVRENLSSMPMAEVGISAVTEAELRFGVARQAGATRLQALVEEFLLRVEIVPWGSEAAYEYAELRSALEDSGTPMGSLDMIIAAQALASSATLVTHDRVFHRVKRLKTEDWTRSG